MKKITFEELHASNTLVLCATGRLAQSLRTQYDQACSSRGIDNWVTLRCQTVDQWLSYLAEEIALKGMGKSPALECLPMDVFSERLIWERAILDVMGDDAQHMFDVASMAQTAAQAHDLITIWNVAVGEGARSKENLQFAQWRERFLAICKKLGFVDRSSLQKAIISELSLGASDDLDLPAKIVFAGFDRFNPVDEELQTRMSDMGIDVCEMESESVEGSFHAKSFPDAAGEILAATIWAKKIIDRQPGTRVAIVVPDLTMSGDLVHDTMQDVLAPATLQASLSEAPMPFNLSLGRSLDKYSVVCTALDLLDAISGAHAIGQDRFSRLLRSPYWSSSLTESSNRAAIEAEIRKSVAPKASLDRYQGFIGFITKDKGDVPVLLSHLNAMKAAAGKFSGKKKLSTWRDVFLDVLKGAGWLYERSLSSHEYQARSAFFDVIERLGGLDLILGELNSSQAVSRLSEMCRERVFQPKTQGDPPIQVLGLLEASGLSFDAIWVTGMVDTAWPPQARPNPLLSAGAQRAAGTPNSCSAVQLAFARNVQHRLNRSAREVIYSWPRMENSSELRPSPLIEHLLPEERLEKPIRKHWIDELFRNPGELMASPIDDGMAPAVKPDEKVRGGTGILRAQAICPAWAYFEFRLGAKGLEEPTEGLDSRKRGTLVHMVLENFWKKVESSAALHAMDEVKLEEEVASAVDAALASFDADRKNVALKPRYRNLERERLIKLIRGWILLEMERAAFKVIGCESRIKVLVGGIEATIQADRIDMLEDGGLLIIDYKTGASIDTKNWASERITEPQMPVYASIHRHPDGEVVGVLFAKVLMKGAAVAGLASSEGLVPGLPSFDSSRLRKLYPEAEFPNWKSVLDAWKSRLESVAQEIQRGDAGVRFAAEGDLNYCKVKPLLRLSERREQLLEMQGKSLHVGGDK